MIALALFALPGEQISTNNVRSRAAVRFLGRMSMIDHVEVGWQEAKLLAIGLGVPATGR